MKSTGGNAVDVYWEAVDRQLAREEGPNDRDERIRASGSISALPHRVSEGAVERKRASEPAHQWSTKIAKSCDRGLGPARGAVFGVALGSVCWALIGLAVYLIAR